MGGCTWSDADKAAPSNLDEHIIRYLHDVSSKKKGFQGKQKSKKLRIEKEGLKKVSVDSNANFTKEMK